MSIIARRHIGDTVFLHRHCAQLRAYQVVSYDYDPDTGTETAEKVLSSSNDIHEAKRMYRAYVQDAQNEHQRKHQPVPAVEPASLAKDRYSSIMEDVQPFKFAENQRRVEKLLGALDKDQFMTLALLLDHMHNQGIIDGMAG